MITLSFCFSLLERFKYKAGLLCKGKRIRRRRRRVSSALFWLGGKMIAVVLTTNFFFFFVFPAIIIAMLHYGNFFGWCFFVRSLLSYRLPWAPGPKLTSFLFLPYISTCTVYIVPASCPVWVIIPYFRRQLGWQRHT